MSAYEVIETKLILSQGAPEDLVPIIREYIQSKVPRVVIVPGAESNQLIVRRVIRYKPHKEGFYGMLDSPPQYPVLDALFAVKVTLAHKGSEIAFHLLDKDSGQLFSDLYSKTIERLRELHFVETPVCAQVISSQGQETDWWKQFVPNPDIQKEIGLWRGGWPTKQIIQQLGFKMKPETFYNHLSDLRHVYGESIVPYRNKRK